MHSRSKKCLNGEKGANLVTLISAFLTIEMALSYNRVLNVYIFYISGDISDQAFKLKKPNLNTKQHESIISPLGELLSNFLTSVKKEVIT